MIERGSPGRRLAGSAAGDRRGRRGRLWVGGLLGLLALLVLPGLLRHRPPPCHRGVPGVKAAGVWLTDALSDVPCPGTGRVVYGATDDHGSPMDALEPLADPAGGYLAVYHSPTRQVVHGQSNFMVSLARSDNLISWRRVRVLDPAGASMPDLRPIPGTPGYLLAYEKSAGAFDYIRLCYYGTLAALLGGRPEATVGLPLRFSRYSDGTPSIVSIDWRGGPARSVVQLAFHYEAPLADGRPGPDREALGTLVGWRRWSARRDRATDGALSALGLGGSHGDRRQFEYAGRTWRVYEAQAKPGSFADWHVLLEDVGSGRIVPLTLSTALGRFATSFGNPIVEVLPGTGGRGRVLAVSVFVFSSGAAAAAAGELVYAQPIPG